MLLDTKKSSPTLMVTEHISSNANRQWNTLRPKKAYPLYVWQLHTNCSLEGQWTIKQHNPLANTIIHYLCPCGWQWCGSHMHGMNYGTWWEQHITSQHKLSCNHFFWKLIYAKIPVDSEGLSEKIASLIQDLLKLQIDMDLFSMS